MNDAMARKFVAARKCGRCYRVLFGASSKQKWCFDCLTPSEKRQREAAKRWRQKNPGL